MLMPLFTCCSHNSFPLCTLAIMNMQFQCVGSTLLLLFNPVVFSFMILSCTLIWPEWLWSEVISTFVYSFLYLRFPQLVLPFKIKQLLDLKKTTDIWMSPRLPVFRTSSGKMIYSLLVAPRSSVTRTTSTWMKVVSVLSFIRGGESLSGENVALKLPGLLWSVCVVGCWGRNNVQLLCSICV